MGSVLLAGRMLRLFIALTLLTTALAQYSACPEPYGLQTYPHEGYCDKFYKCANGTLTEEVCENGLVFDGHGSVHNHCNYNWAVDCGKRVYDDTPISSPGCLYQYGIYPVGEGCQTTFFKLLKVLPTRLPATKVCPIHPRSMFVTILTMFLIARNSPREWLGSSVPPLMSSHPTL